jgi:hypothetical protein
MIFAVAFKPSRSRSIRFRGFPKLVQKNGDRVPKRRSFAAGVRHDLAVGEYLPGRDFLARRLVTN